MSFKQELEEIVGSDSIEARDLTSCLNYCYDHNLGSLCADKCYSNNPCAAETKEKIQALMSRYAAEKE